MDNPNIFPPIDLTNIINQPYDTLKLTALKLSYEDIISLCKSSKKLARLCRDNEFWKNKILKDYPNVNLNELSSTKYKAEYLLLYSLQLQKEAREEHNNPDDKEFVKLQEKYNMIRMKSGYKELTGKNLKQADKINSKMEKLRMAHEERIKLLKEKALKYRRLARRDLPLKEEIKYKYIKVTEDQLGRFYSEFMFRPWPIRLEEFNYTMKDNIRDRSLNIGNLIGIGNNRNNELIIGYISEIYYMPYIEFSVIRDLNNVTKRNLPNTLTEKYNSSEVMKMYELPFIIEEYEIGNEIEYEESEGDEEAEIYN